MSLPYYESPEQAASAAQGETDRALGVMVYQMGLYLAEKQAIRNDLDQTDDEDEIAELETRLKLVRDEERSLHRIVSALQSRLRVG